MKYCILSLSRDKKEVLTSIVRPGLNGLIHPPSIASMEREFIKENGDCSILAIFRLEGPIEPWFPELLNHYRRLLSLNLIP